MLHDASHEGGQVGGVAGDEDEGKAAPHVDQPPCTPAFGRLRRERVAEQHRPRVHCNKTQRCSQIHEMIDEHSYFGSFCLDLYGTHLGFEVPRNLTQVPDKILLILVILARSCKIVHGYPISCPGQDLAKITKNSNILQDYQYIRRWASLRFVLPFR